MSKCRLGWAWGVWVTGLLLLASVAPASAQLKIDITSGVTDPLPIAVTPFVNDPRESSSVVMQDLERSGRFVSRSRTADDYLVTGTVRSAAEAAWSSSLSSSIF